MPSPLLELFPSKNKLVTDAGYMSAPWLEWLELTLVARLEDTASGVASESLTAQAGSIGLTPLVVLAEPGIYRVSYFARVTQAATTSSSLQVTVTATDGAVTYTEDSAAVTTNTTDTVLAGSFIVQSDLAPISYSTTYASVGGTPMLYSLSLLLEQLT